MFITAEMNLAVYPYPRHGGGNHAQHKALIGAAMFPLILAAVLVLGVLYICGRHYLKKPVDLIWDFLDVLF
jgi:hypothetical protein